VSLPSRRGSGDARIGSLFVEEGELVEGVAHPDILAYRGRTRVRSPG
jgi:hypothetical protein